MEPTGSRFPASFRAVGHDGFCEIGKTFGVTVHRASHSEVERINKIFRLFHVPHDSVGPCLRIQLPIRSRWSIMLILGIETSCDETAAAVVEDGKRVLSDVVSSQVAVHSPYGGVVPELASRKHVEMILPVIAEALTQAGKEPAQLDAIAVTQGPGLVGALLVGLGAAKAMAYSLRKPLIAVNHLEGHMHAAFLGKEPITNPFVCLVVSGGHTALYRVNPDSQIKFLGTTRDDAAGEAFDKVAKLLGLGYPGGVVIDRLAANGNPHAFRFPKAYLEKGSLDFSFSGIKTAVANFVRRFGPPAEQTAGERGQRAEGRGQRGEERNFDAQPTTSDTQRAEAVPGADSYRLEDLAASFQEAVVDVLVDKTIMAAKAAGVSDVAVVGGVSANRHLRQRLAEEIRCHHLRLHLPSLRYCTDNAAMIAAAAFTVWKRAGFSQNFFDLDAVSRWFY